MIGLRQSSTTSVTLDCIKAAQQVLNNTILITPVAQ